MKEYFSSDMSPRQIAVVLHTLSYVGGNPDDVTYLKSEEYFTDIFPIDLAIIKPTEYFNNYILQTVGLSSYYFDKDIARSELMMVLPNTWKPVFDKQEYNWPRQLLMDIAYGAVDNKRGTMIGQVHLPSADYVYEGSPDIVGGIIVMSEQLPFEYLDEEIDESYTKFLQVVPISKDDLSKIEEVGPAKFIEYELHDSEGEKFTVKLKEKELEGIDKIIKQNEDNLKKNS